VHAFIEKEECSKKEKTRRQDWQIAYFTFAFHAGPGFKYVMSLTMSPIQKKSPRASTANRFLQDSPFQMPPHKIYQRQDNRLTNQHKLI